MAAAVLAFEAVVIGLSAPVMINVTDVDPAPALLAGLGLAVLAVVAAGTLRNRWGYALGWTVQVGALALGFVTAAMFVVGALFTGLWVLSLVLGRRLQRLEAARTSGPQQPAPRTPD